MADGVKLSIRQWALVAAASIVLVLLGVYLGSGRKTTVVVAPPQALPQTVGQLTPQQQAVVDLRTRAAMQFVFFHELGHMVINQLKLPAIGPEEDVADEFATYTLTDVLKAAPDEQKDFYSEIVYSGALFWRISGAIRQAQNGQNAAGGITWYDEHAPDLRRYYNILCVAVGADPLRFAGKAALDGVPQSRLTRCDEEYKTKHAAWDTLLAPHMGGFWHRKLGTRRLTLDIGPLGKNEWQPFEATYTQGGYFQEVLDGISSTVVLPQTIPVVVKSCNVSNAWWSPTEKRITLCHEFFQDVTNTFALAILSGAREQAGSQGGGQAPSQPQQPQQPPQPAPPQPPPTPAPQPGGQQPDPLAPAGALPSDAYRDQQGRFSVRIPSGWQAKPTGPDGVALAHGAAFVNIMVGPDGGGPQQVVTNLGRQIAGQWTQVRSSPIQALTLGGRAGYYQMIMGTNPKGVPARLYVASAPLDRGQALAMVTSVAEAEFEASKEALGFIQLSLRIGEETASR